MQVYRTIFGPELKSFYRKANQIHPLGIRIQPYLQAIGFKRKNAIQYSIPGSLSWFLKQPFTNFSSLYHFYTDKFIEVL